MSTTYTSLQAQLREKPKRWLVTGSAGFIGSNLVQSLLELGQKVSGLDNYATGYRENLEDVRRVVGEQCWRNFAQVEGDIRSADDCRRVMADVDVVLHQAALGSVPRSIADPLASHRSNIDGFMNILLAARDVGVSKVVYASSSSVYGDSEQLPKREDVLGRVLSPYAATKRADELYAEAFANVYGMELIGLRYFNVFGPRQDPQGAYAAVIPKWIGRMLHSEPCEIYGDGETSRDFCFVGNVVQANILAGVSANDDSLNQVYNIACGEQLSLNELHSIMSSSISELMPAVEQPSVFHLEFRAGDVRHSLANIDKASSLLGYSPTILAKEGLKITTKWFVDKHLTGAILNSSSLV